MADLTIQQRFGSNVFVQADQEGKLLFINLDDLQNSEDGGDFTNGLGLDTSGITTSNANEYASKIFWALLQLSKQNQPENNIDETVGIYCTNQGRRNVTRNGVAQIGYQELVTGYRDDTSGLVLDPDDIGSNTNSGQE